MSTPEELEVGRRNLLAQLRQSLRRDLTEYPVDAATMRELVEVLEGLAPIGHSVEEIAARIADCVPHADLDGFSLSERLWIGKAVAPLFQDLMGGEKP